MLANSRRLPTAPFKEVLCKGKSSHTLHLSLHSLRASDNHTRLGIVVSKKHITSATGRHRLKRRIAHIAKPLLVNGNGDPRHYILFSKKEAHKLHKEDLRAEIGELFSRAQMIF